MRHERRARLRLETLETRLAPATFTVVNTNDDGTGSLRQAIVDANATANSGGPDRIEFAIPGGGVHTIAPTTELPTIAEAVVIDGYTQPGASVNALAVGDNAVILIELSGTGFASGVGSNGLALEGNGTTVRGLAINAWPDDGFAGGNGIAIRAGSGHTIEGNFLGLAPDGTTDRGNASNGVVLFNTSGATIGGSTPAARNLISANACGVHASGTGHAILGNLIGTDLTGTEGRGNDVGLILVGVAGAALGGLAAGEGNVIAFNGSGVRVLGDDVVISGNSIFANELLGIDLNGDGPTVNDPGDSDAGPNGLQNAPELLTAELNGGTATTIDARLDSVANEDYRIEFFSVAVPDNEGGEGQRFLGFTQVTTDATGLVNFQFTAPVQAIDSISATATRLSTGETSEFSQTVTAQGLAVLSVTNTSDAGPGSLRQAILDANAHGNSGSFPDRIHFAIPGAGVHVIAPHSALPVITEGVEIDGYTQPGTRDNAALTGTDAVLLIELSGAQLGSVVGLEFQVDNSILRGLSLTGFVGTAIQIAGRTNVVEGNFVGVRPDGTASGNGIGLNFTADASSNRVGGAAPELRNLISANIEGIRAAGDNLTVQGNLIGTDVTATANRGNGKGVFLLGSDLARIGGPIAGEGNVIAFNTEAGVLVRIAGNGGTGNTISGNSLFRNGPLGIDLDPVGETANDPLDADAGANLGQNKPALSSIETIGTTTTVRGTLNSVANETFNVEFFATAIDDLIGVGGETFLGFIQVTTDANGDAAFEFSGTLPGGVAITATATNLSTGDTSEFSNDVATAVPVPPPPPPPPPPPTPVAVGRFALGGQGVVQLFDAATGQKLRDVTPFAGYLGGVRVAVGDVTGDGLPDLIAGALVASSHVKVFDGATGAEVSSFLAFDGFTGGVNVGSWDVTGDGFADVVVGTATASSHVKVFSGADGSLFRSFLAFAGFAGGVSVAGGDVDGDGIDDVVVGTASAASHVKAFRGSDLAELRSFVAFAGFSGGVMVASGDVDGDGLSDFVAGAATLTSHVKAFAGGDLRELASAIAFVGVPTGVTVGSTDRDGDGNDDLLVAGGGTVKILAADLTVLDQVFAQLPAADALAVAGH